MGELGDDLSPTGPRPSAGDETPSGRRVTLVFSDLKGSTALAERFDAETLRSVLTAYFDAMGTVFAARGGSIAKIIGDAIVAVFDAGDDPAGAARRAAAAAIETQAVLAELNVGFQATWGVQLQNRTGVATGTLAFDDAASRSDAEVLAGEVVGTAESLESASPVGAALADEATVALLGPTATVEAVGAVPRKGHPEQSVDAWRLVEVAGDPDGPAQTDGLRLDAARSPAAGPEENRRTVTIVFADPHPVAAGGALDAEATHTAMSAYFSVVAPILERHGATVEKFIGDALMAVFGLAVRREDDAVRAVRAAAEVQAALRDLDESGAAGPGVTFANPIGVNTGTVVAGDPATGQRLVTGDAVNVAARLEQTAGPGEVILGPLTRQLVGDAVEVEELEPLVLKGKAEPVPAFRLVRVVDPTGERGVRHELPLVGRDRELDVLLGAVEAATTDRHANRISLVGDVGVGKSRLVAELRGRLDPRVRVLRGNCLAYGEGITFWPLLRVVQGAAGIEEDDDAEVARGRLLELVDGDAELAARLGSIAGLVDAPFPVHEVVWALRRLLEQLASTDPVVAIVDDVHWAEPTLLDVLGELVTTVAAPVTFLCTARPDGPEGQADFVAGAPSVELGPLADEDCDRFLRLLLGGSAVDGATRARIVEAAAGNPLFLEQLLSMLVDDGRLRWTGDRWRLHGDLAAVALPATVEALLAARLDLLPGPERQTIGPASVIGRHFARDALLHVLDPDQRPGIDGRLDTLVTRDLVLPEPDEDPAFRFQHQLVRDVTYNGLLKATRAEIHERFVAWAEARNTERDRNTEFDEILGYHLEHAHRYRAELGPLDERGIALGVAASVRLGGAGERALARGDMHAAANLLTRAAALLPDDSGERPRRLLLAANALHEVGELDDAIATYEAAAGAAAAKGDEAARWAARIDGLRLQYLVGRIEDSRVVVAEVADALAAVEPLGDPDALSRVWQLQLNVGIEACRWSAAQRAAEAVIGHARAAGNQVLAVRTMPLLAFLAQKGPMPVPEATERCEEILREVAGDRRSTSLAQLELAMLAAMALDLDRARHLCRDTRDALAELGWEMQGALVSLASGPIELLADEPARAEAELRRDYEVLEGMGERNFISLTAILLAEAVYRQGRFDEAAELVASSREVAAPDDVAVQILLRSVDGKLRARAGEIDAGVALVDEALAIMAITEDPSGSADLHLDRAEVAQLAGDRAGVEEHLTAARARYREKGNRAGERRTDRLAARLAAGEDPHP